MSRSRVLTIVLCTLSLSAGVDSSGPILQDARPLFGENLRLQFYTLRKGFADEPEQASFKWDGTRYTRIGGGMSDIVSFTVHRFEGRAYVIQSAAVRRPNVFEYAVAYKLTEGVYQVTAIDEDDADPSTRARYCQRVEDSYCRVTTQKQLFAFARATDARQKGDGALVLRLPNDSSESSR
ncbi:MAG: hypothetical protein WA754_00450 [Pseudolabrys sp.]